MAKGSTNPKSARQRKPVAKKAGAAKPQAKRGRPAFAPSDDQRHTVERGAAMGFTQDVIAGLIGVSEPTLRKHFAAELASGEAKVLLEIGESLMRQAMAGNVTAQIFYLKTRGGWREDGTSNKLGKKALAQQDAEQGALAGDDFAPLPPPGVSIQ